MNAPVSPKTQRGSKKASRSATKLAVLLMASAAMGCAQERVPASRDARTVTVQDEHSQKPANPDAKTDAKPRRLETITWNSVTHELTWVVSNGDKAPSADKKEGNGSYKPLASQTYQIQMDKATMTFDKETRRFSKEEAQNVHMLMDIISKYAIESTVWWEDGQGEKVNDKEKDKKAPAPGELHAKAPDAGLSANAIQTGSNGSGRDVQDLQLRLDALEHRLADLEKHSTDTPTLSGPARLSRAVLNGN